MKFMKSQDIRRMWLDFFASKGHHVEPGSSLIPKNDPTLLWINAGVAALKKYFDGSEIPPSRRITNAQKCIRTNDIENVGDATHLTFFEMLGTWASVAVACGLRNWDARALEPGLSSRGSQA